MKIIATNLSLGLWLVASVALAGSSHAKAPSHACFEGGAQGKAVPTAKTQEECQKLGEKFTWTDAHQKHHATKMKDPAQQAKAPEALTPPAMPEGNSVPAPVEAPKK